jgi:hypothetical protein
MLLTPPGVCGRTTLCPVTAEGADDAEDADWAKAGPAAPATIAVAATATAAAAVTRPIPNFGRCREVLPNSDPI